MKKLSSRAKPLWLPAQSSPDSCHVSSRPAPLEAGPDSPPGSLPSRCQINQKINAFWKLVGDAIGVDLYGMDYPSRLQTLLAHRIGLWDVIAQARRQGSLDSDIRDHSRNDLQTLLAQLPALETIAFNGGTAGKIGLQALGEQARRYQVLLLPSSSPAYAALSYALKLESWRQLVALTRPAAERRGYFLKNR